MPRIGATADSILSASDRDFLYRQQTRALRYFLDNQSANGLVYDRQRNRGAFCRDGICSLTATGMGCIGLALAAAPEYGLLTRADASKRIAVALRTCVYDLPSDRGVLPHFVDAASGTVVGDDACSTIETAWLVAGALWSAAALGDGELEDLSNRLADRVDWAYWSRADGLIRHGKDSAGRFLRCAWDRLNGETVFMYALAAGANEKYALASGAWQTLEPFHGTAAGLRFVSADLGLFVFQYGLDLLDLREWEAPGAIDLWTEAGIATKANLLACRAAAARFSTYRRFWGLSAGDGPDFRSDAHVYREYSPLGLIDGTAHLMAALASIAHRPGDVLDCLLSAERDEHLAASGRYGFSNVNIDANWVGRDMVGIDAGAAVLALDNFLCDNRVRNVFHGLPCIRRAMDRLAFVRRNSQRQAA